MGDIFEDYIDENGCLHIDARNKPKKNYTVINLKADINDIKTTDNPPKEIIMHHVNMIDNRIQGSTTKTYWSPLVKKPIY